MLYSDLQNEARFANKHFNEKNTSVNCVFPDQPTRRTLVLGLSGADEYVLSSGNTIYLQVMGWADGFQFHPQRQGPNALGETKRRQ